MSKTANARAPRVLVADDEDNARLLGKLSLEQIGCEVVLAADGNEALAAAAKDPPDMVLLDVIMPGMDGFEVCQRLRERPATAETPIVLLTALDDIDAVEQAYEVGATDFITKPVSWTLLQHRARFVLRASNAIQDLARSARSLEDAQRIAGLGSWEWDADADRLTGSTGLWRILDCEPAAVTTQEAFFELIHPSDRARVQTARTAALRAGASYELDYRLLGSDKENRHIHESGEAARDRLDAIIGLVGTIHDETERNRARQRIHHMTYFDAATGLPNERSLREQLETLIESTDPSELHGAVIHVQVGAVDRVNDTLGNQAANELVHSVARRLRGALGSDTRYSGALLARVGADRFALLVPRLAAEIDPVAVATELAATVSDRYSVNDEQIVADARVGIVCFPDQGDEVAQLLARAQAAANQASPGTARLFEPAFEEGSRERLTIEGLLHGAVERGELTLAYQPIIHTDNGYLHSVEALVRWNNPEIGSISPEHFIPIAEQMGVIDEITRWTLEQACRDGAAWQGLTPRELKVAVNLSATQLTGRTDIVALTTDILQQTGLSPASLELELTETMMVEAGLDVRPVLEALRELGLSLALDDFGTGYSSLSYLADFPMNTLKIDQTFIAEVPGTKGAEGIVRAIIAMSHVLGLGVVSEGIETPEQLDFVRSAGGDYGQGYLMSEPVSGDRITQILRSGRPLIDVGLETSRRAS